MIGLAIAFLASAAGGLLAHSIVGNNAPGLNCKCRQLLHWETGQWLTQTFVWAGRGSSSLVESWGCNRRNRLYWFEMASYVECLKSNPLLTDRSIWHQKHSPILSHSHRRAARMADRSVLFQVAVSDFGLQLIVVLMFPKGRALLLTFSKFTGFLAMKTC